MHDKYGVLVKKQEMDKKGYIYTVEWFQTIAMAYSYWVKNSMKGDIIRTVEATVLEKQ